MIGATYSSALIKGHLSCFVSVIFASCPSWGSWHNLPPFFPLFRRTIIFQPCDARVMRTQSTNLCCPVRKHGKAVNKFKSSLSCGPERERGRERESETCQSLVSQLLTTYGAFSTFQSTRLDRLSHEMVFRLMVSLSVQPHCIRNGASQLDLHQVDKSQPIIWLGIHL